MSTIDDISASLDEIMARGPACRRSIIVPLARAKALGWTRQYRGRRARRQAFYSRHRMSRVLKRLIWKIDASPALAQADKDLLLLGTSVVQWTDAGPRRIDPRTVFFGFDGQEVPPPDGSPSDGDIAGLVRTFNIDANTPFDRSFYGQDEAGRVLVVDTDSRPLLQTPSQ